MYKHHGINLWLWLVNAAYAVAVCDIDCAYMCEETAPVEGHWLESSRLWTATPQLLQTLGRGLLQDPAALLLGRFPKELA